MTNVQSNIGISVIIPTYKEPEYLDICLTSTCKGMRENDEIIVVVDGYYELNKTVLSKYPKVRVLINKDNRGIQYSTNVGVWSAKNDVILVVNDDNVFPVDWSERISQEIDLEGITSLYKTRVYSLNQMEHGRQTPVGFEFIKQDFGAFASEFDVDAFEEYELNRSQQFIKNQQQTVVSGGALLPFLMNKWFYVGVGGWDVLFNSPHVCDWDFFMKLELMGAEFLKVVNICMYHFGGKATKTPDSNKPEVNFNAKEQQAHAMLKYKWNVGAVGYDVKTGTRLTNNKLWHNRFIK